MAHCGGPGSSFQSKKGPRASSATTTKSSVTRTAFIITGPSETHSQKGIHGSHHPKTAAADCPNTFKTAPERLFPAAMAKEVIREVLQTKLSDVAYDAESCNGLTSDLASIIRARLRQLDLQRYKLVTYVVVGQKDGATLTATSRCLWNDKVDNFVEESFSNGSLYAVVTAYGVYAE